MHYCYVFRVCVFCYGARTSGLFPEIFASGCKTLEALTTRACTSFVFA